MKKLLNLIVVVMVSSVSTINVISCSKNNPNGLTNNQLNAASTIAKIGISSQTSTYNLSSNDMLDSLNSKDKDLDANIKSIFANNGTSDDFDKNSKINLQNGSDQINEANAMMPNINLPKIGSVDIESIINLLPTIVGMAGSYILPLLVNLVSSNFDPSVLGEIFSSKLISGSVIKDTIGSLNKDNKWSIDNSQYANKSYSTVLKESMINFKSSFKNVYNNIITPKKSISNLTSKDFDNIVNGLLVIVNYISQFQMTTTTSYVNKEQKLYDKIPGSDDSKINNNYNEIYKGAILNENYKTLNAANFSTTIENITNSDQTNGLGFQQILFTVFGTAMIKNDSGSYTKFTFDELPLGQLAEGLLEVIEPSYSENYPLIFWVVGILVTQLSTNQMLNNIVDLLSVGSGILPTNIKSDVLNLIKGIKSNKNWYSDEIGGNVAGTVWTDLWSGTGSNSLLDLILKSFNNILPSAIQNIMIDNVGEIYKVLENTKINLPSFNLGGTAKADTKKSETLLTVKSLLEALGKDKIVETLLSPQTFELIEELLDGFNSPSIIKQTLNDYNQFLISNVSDATLTKNADKYKNFIDSTTDKNGLTYLMGEAIAYTVSSKNSDESSNINKDTNNILTTIWNYSSNDSAFAKFKTNVLNSVANANEDIFNGYVDYVFDDLNWTESKIIHKGNDYSFQIYNKSNKYNVSLNKISSDKYYKISVSKSEN